MYLYKHKEENSILFYEMYNCIIIIEFFFEKENLLYFVYENV